MKKTYYTRLAAALCVAGLSTSMLSSAKAESTVVSPDALSSLQNQSQVSDSQLFKPTLFSSTSAGFEANAATIAPSVASGPGQSYSPIQHYAIIPEPTTISCLALGLGALVGFKRLKIGQKK